MNRLNQKIIETLKQHPEGEAFFNALDAMVRGDMDILSAFISFTESQIIDPIDKTLVLTGQFGIALMDIYGDKLRKMFGDVILINGGIRTGQEPIIYRESLKNPKCIMFDDSFYSGTTRNKIESRLRLIHSGARIIGTYVVYDGSFIRDENVFSMFRYHTERKTLSNFDEIL